jgi:predicted GNAT family N-acyltransferase
MTVTIRQARKEEIAWINARYSEVDFLPSDFDNEFIAVAEVDSKRAGLGRLVKIDGESFELGGMLVFDEFRGSGTARRIVEFLLDHSKGKRVFCIPFEHLFEFYNSAGFVKCDDFYSVPEEVLKKFRWCQRTYEHGVFLLEQIVK